MSSARITGSINVRIYTTCDFSVHEHIRSDKQLVQLAHHLLQGLHIVCGEPIAGQVIPVVAGKIPADPNGHLPAVVETAPARTRSLKQTCLHDCLEQTIIPCEMFRSLGPI